MAGLVNSEAAAALDALFPTGATTDKVGFSTNGTSEFAGLGRADIGSWSAATVADPAKKANSGDINTADLTADGTISHSAIFTAAGAQRTDWQALVVPRALLTGDSASFKSGELSVTLT